VLDGEVWDREQVANFLFNDFGDAVGGDGDGDARLVAGDPSSSLFTVPKGLLFCC